MTNTSPFFQASSLGFSNFNDYFGALSFRRGALCGTLPLAVASRFGGHSAEERNFTVYNTANGEKVKEPRGRPSIFSRFLPFTRRFFVFARLVLIARLENFPLYILLRFNEALLLWRRLFVVKILLFFLVSLFCVILKSKRAKRRSLPLQKTSFSAFDATHAFAFPRFTFLRADAFRFCVPRPLLRRNRFPL